MKLEKRFLVEENRLYYIEGKRELPLAGDRLDAAACTASFASGGALPEGRSVLLLLELPWTQVGCDEAGYNEEFLASFRDFLKALEEQGGAAAVIPLADRQPADAEALTASFKHCARRIKDCASVAGFAVPGCLSGGDADAFMAELSAKHEQYVFFSSDPRLLENSKIVKLPA